MLFELHDIILHRLWKWRKAKYVAFMKATFNPAYEYIVLAELKKDSRTYSRLYFWEAVTKRWYLNHKRKEPYASLVY